MLQGYEIVCYTLFQKEDLDDTSYGINKNSIKDI